MGGQSAGEKASELAVEHICRRLLVEGAEESDRLRGVLTDAVAGANAEIVALGNVDPTYHGMGTTVVFLVPCLEGFVAGNLGDSRAYRLRDGELRQLTKDHSLTQALIDAGTITPDEARTHRYKNMLFKYLGSKEGSEGAETFLIDRQSGDRLMICSDGVTDGVEDAQVADILKESADPQEASEQLVEAAIQGGSRDNITCVTIFVD